MLNVIAVERKTNIIDMCAMTLSKNKLTLTSLNARRPPQEKCNEEHTVWLKYVGDTSCGQPEKKHWYMVIKVENFRYWLRLYGLNFINLIYNFFHIQF